MGYESAQIALLMSNVVRDLELTSGENTEEQATNTRALAPNHQATEVPGRA